MHRTYGPKVYAIAAAFSVAAGFVLAASHETRAFRVPAWWAGAAYCGLSRFFPVGWSVGVAVTLLRRPAQARPVAELYAHLLTLAVTPMTFWWVSRTAAAEGSLAALPLLTLAELVVFLLATHLALRRSNADGERA